MAGVNHTPEFREVVGFPGYVVSSEGEVLSFRRGKFAAILNPSLRKDGYFNLMLCGDSGIKSKLLHHVVLEAFSGPKPDGMETRHLDGDKSNNRKSNLEWGTPAENGLDRIKHGTVFRPELRYGEKHPSAKLNLEKAARILLRGEPSRKLATEFGVSKNLIQIIRRRGYWGLPTSKAS